MGFICKEPPRQVILGMFHAWELRRQIKRASEPDMGEILSNLRQTVCRFVEKHQVDSCIVPFYLLSEMEGTHG